MQFLQDPPPYFLFTGKGGVGKTSLACAAAVALADRGRRVLIVSTDPASNLDAVLETGLANTPRPVHEVPGLLGMNIDPEQAANDYRERTLGPYRGTASPTELAMLEERLSGACTVEVAAFDEFTLLLTEGGSTHRFEHVIFDTAPTGHTLRLLQLPAAWTGFLETSAAEESCIGPLSGLKAQQARYAETVRALGDPAQTLLVLVARPDRVALLEAARSSRELAALGMNNQHFVLNGVFRANDPGDSLARAYERRARIQATRGSSSLRCQNRRRCWRRRRCRRIYVAPASSPSPGWSTPAWPRRNRAMHCSPSAPSRSWTRSAGCAMCWRIGLPWWAGRLMQVNVEWENWESDGRRTRSFLSAFEHGESVHEFQARHPLPPSSHCRRPLWSGAAASSVEPYDARRVNPSDLPRTWTLSCI
jgi:TRC40/GET3/ArsA family transport-energizing ATPase